MSCSCHSPLLKYLADTLLTEDVIKRLKDTLGKKLDAFELQTVSIMYTGGTIRPMKDGIVDTVEAIGFHCGKVVAAGSMSEVTTEMNGLGVTYTIVELSDGQTLLPGLIEPHVHIVPTALTLGWHDFGPFEGQYLRKKYDKQWLQSEIKKAKSMLKGDEWILGINVDPSLMPPPAPWHKSPPLNQLQSFSCDVLDKMEPNVPLMMMSASGHTCYINTRALRKVYDSNKSIQHEYSTFDEYRKHVNGDGGLQEMVEMTPAVDAIPLLQKLDVIWGIKKHFDLLFETANQRGVTLMYDAAMSGKFKLLLDIYLLVAKTRVRIGYAELCESFDDAEKIHQYVPPPKDFQNVYQGSVKVISDGSNQGLTGYQSEPYCCEPGNKGIFDFLPYSKYESLVKTIADKGWPLMIHANGDKAVEYTIAAYKEALGGASGLTKRHRIEHCSLLSKDGLESMHALGLSPSFLIGHVGYWGYVFSRAIFEEKAEHLDLVKSALDKGMRITLHSDNFVSPLGPLRMMEQAITRIMEENRTGTSVLNEKEKISAAQALRAVTYDAAWQCHADQWVGSLEEGKMADYVILEEDPVTKANPVGMRNIPVLETWVEGIKMYCK